MSAFVSEILGAKIISQTLPDSSSLCVIVRVKGFRTIATIVKLFKAQLKPISLSKVEAVKGFTVAALVLSNVSFRVCSRMFKSEAHLVPQKSIFEFTLKDIKGHDTKLSKYANKIILLLNVASKCGLTHRNYTELQELYEKYKKDGLEVLAFPCNQFADMEPGTNAQIKEFVEEKYGGTFPLFEKIEVNGPDQHPLYKFLKATRGGIRGFYRDNIKWNFAKFVIGKDGVVIERFTPTTSPKMIEKFLRSLLFPPKDNGSGGKKEIRSAQCSRLVMDCADCTGCYWETSWGPKGGELFWGEERQPEKEPPPRKGSRPSTMAKKSTVSKR